MSMQGLPRVPLSTGSVTGLPPASSVTWSRSDTVHSYSGASSSSARRPGRSRGSCGRSGGRGRRDGVDYRTTPAWPRPADGRIRPGSGNANGRHEAAVAGCANPGRPGRAALLGVALAELVDPAAGVHDLVLARVERVRGRGHLDLDQRVLVAVLPLDRLLGGGAEGGTGEDLEVRGHVLEHDLAVFGVDIGLHGGTGVTGSRAL